MPEESEVVCGDKGRPTFERTPMTPMSSDGIDRIATDTSSYDVDVFGRESDVFVSHRAINGGKPNILRPISIRSVSHERDVGCVGTLPFPAGAGSASRPIILLDHFGREF